MRCPLPCRALWLRYGLFGGPNSEGRTAAIVCDTPKNIVQQEPCYTYLPIGGPVLSGPLSEWCLGFSCSIRVFRLHDTGSLLGTTRETKTAIFALLEPNSVANSDLVMVSARA